MMAWRHSTQGRGASLSDASALAANSGFRAKPGRSKLDRIRELEAEVKKLTKERNSLREALIKLQNATASQT